MFLLGAIAAMGSLGIHMVVPALPLIAADLPTTANMAQLTIGIYLGGLAIGQLAWGPVADAVGRRPVLLSSIFAFALGSLAAGLAPGIYYLLAARALQAIGASGALIACRAIVSDASELGPSARKMATLASITLISPAAAPMVGSLLVRIGGWRLIFATLAVLALTLAVRAWFVQPESHRMVPKRPTMAMATSAYSVVLMDRAFILLALGNAVMSGGFYYFLAESPFVFLGRYGLSIDGAAGCYLVISCFIVIGTFVVRHLEGRWPDHILYFSTGATALGSIGLVTAIAAPASLALLLISMCTIGLGAGISAPTTLALALRNLRPWGGSAASMFGTMQMAASAAIVMLSGSLTGADNDFLIIVIAAMSMASILLITGGHAARPAPLRASR